MERVVAGLAEGEVFAAELVSFWDAPINAATAALAGFGLVCVEGEFFDLCFDSAWAAAAVICGGLSLCLLPGLAISSTFTDFGSDCGGACEVGVFGTKSAIN